MDFAPRRDDRLREIVDEAFDQAMEGERAEPFGQSRRPSHVDQQKHARFHAWRIIAAGDEIDEHVLAKQTVHVEDEDEHERSGERKQHVAALNAVLAGRWKERAAQLEAEQDDAEVDDGLDHHMRRKGRPAKRGAQGPVHNKRIECRQDAANQRAGQRAAREARKRERRPASLPDAPFSIGGAQRGRERGRPEDVPERLLQSREHHDLAVALLLYDPSLTRGDSGRFPNLYGRNKPSSMPAAAKTSSRLASSSVRRKSDSTSAVKARSHAFPDSRRDEITNLTHDARVPLTPRASAGGFGDGVGGQAWGLNSRASR